MAFEDKKMICKDCSKEFVFTAGEQEFFAQKGFTNPPSRCKPCNAARKTGGTASAAPAGQSAVARQMYDVTCERCKKPTRVPFRPTGKKPVYCKDCFQEMK
ncbi:MAG: zinc-ribbon domain containing protein [Candidatus Riflebacteria bacterium]|nr:zinc-ribbon domain containing protein [Candidatus Riflebacteria bacterium]